MKILLVIVLGFGCGLALAEDVVIVNTPEFVERITAHKIPKINTQDTSLIEFIDFIGHRIRELDSEPTSGMSFILSGFIDSEDGDSSALGSIESEKKINYVRDDVSVGEIFVELARAYNIEFHITNIGIIVTPSGAKPFPNAKANEGDIYLTYK
jgi:hypothetical protein